jgi:hypothetical protein
LLGVTLIELDSDTDAEAERASSFEKSSEAPTHRKNLYREPAGIEGK